DLLQFDGVKWVKVTPTYIETETDPAFTAWDKSTGINITESQISDLANYIETETDPTVAANFDFTGAATGDLLQFDGVKWVKVTPTYIETETDPAFTAWDKSTGINITESQISDLGTYIETETQTLSDVIANNNSANGQIKNVSDPTDAQDVATKGYVDLLETQIEALQIAVGLKIKDIDGNIYNTVTIGTQVWMAENLKTTKYNDGTDIPLVTNNADWEGLSTPAYCWYQNDEATYGNTYGVLYNWYTVNTGNLCPTGWHVPTDAEWTTLTDYVGGIEIAGTKLKATTVWYDNGNGTDDYGFSALPGGYRNINGMFGHVGYYGYWWSSTEYGASYAWYRSMTYHYENVNRYYNNERDGSSVRCVRD
ncbi:MAG: fibrobacter succinogenes major paralogous domain-containing protein, partial [Bacteroidales bacterium]|nr:fibrobacter succinogenes major paralogous domain-containing protein [Bacteroidales bacterium]